MSNKRANKESNELFKYLIVRYNGIGPYRINGLLKLEKNLLNDTLENRFISGQLIYTTPMVRISYLFDHGKILEETHYDRIFKKKKICVNYRPLYNENPTWPSYESYDAFGQLKKGKYVFGL